VSQLNCAVTSVIGRSNSSANGSNVHTVFIGGRKVVEAGKILGFDEADVLEQARSRSEVLRAKLGIATATAWPVS